MAQLPPKIPCSMMTCSLNWPAAAAAAATTTSAAALQPSWVDEFLDFSAAKRGAHRRSISDSGPFLEAGPRRRPPNSTASTTTSSCPCSPTTPRPRRRRCRCRCGCRSRLRRRRRHRRRRRTTTASVTTRRRPARPSTKRRRASARPSRHPPLQRRGRSRSWTPGESKANRQSAQRSRVRKLQYIAELERSVTTLQKVVITCILKFLFSGYIFACRLRYLHCRPSGVPRSQRSILSVGNSHLKQRIAALAQDKIFKDAHQEALKKEIERLRQVYHQQNLKKMSTPTSEPVVCTENGLLS
uniref:Uncharacterized protein n=1 Tax=Ananas comosus var. bracteatus TaxID=296719 RepID=A0A6V7PU56_ANACO|nr:unnamed protein product [Ananas comosus var. bracteatus]